MILADEPVASLDPVLAHSRSCSTWKRSTRNDSVTVLCSLHFLDLVHRYADRVVALNEGQLVFDGLPQDIDDTRFKEIYGQEAERGGLIIMNKVQQAPSLRCHLLVLIVLIIYAYGFEVTQVNWKPPEEHRRQEPLCASSAPWPTRISSPTNKTSCW